jgi:hypothetical protein
MAALPEPATIELPRLPTTLLFGIEWQGGHIHEFALEPDNYGRIEPGLDLPDEVINEEHVLLREALAARKTFIYVDNYSPRVLLRRAYSAFAYFGGKLA